MLSGLSVRNVVLIEALELEFEQGLSALTGETGAGKSIILDALGMATGARSDRALVRAGTDKAECMARFTLKTDHPVWEILRAQDIDFDLGEDLTLRRTLRADGRSRAFVNDSPVSAKLLAELGGQLLDVHGQHDGRGLLDSGRHVTFLDMFGGHKAELTAVRASFFKKQETQQALDALLDLQAKANADRDFLRRSISELEDLAPCAGEEEVLAQKRRFLQGAEGALGELNAAKSALGDGASEAGEDFEARLSTALAGIERVRDKFGDGEPEAAQALQLAAQSLERALLETQDAREAVARAAQQFAVQPGQLDETEKRLFALRGLSRKFGVPISDLVVKQAELTAELAQMDVVDADVTALREAVEQTAADYAQAADALSQSRQAAAARLDAAVLSELPPLKMERARFKTEITPVRESAQGIDRVRFLVSTNPGTQMGPLDKIASGGELARLSLAITVALAGQGDMVMVFDEVDQGVGGAVATAVGKRLARLADHAQVFTVTHSPQVAACAHMQFRIEKTSKQAVTNTHVTPIKAEAREEEIARMLAGETITPEARAAARQLMAS